MCEVKITGINIKLNSWDDIEDYFVAFWEQNPIFKDFSISDCSYLLDLMKEKLDSGDIKTDCDLYQSIQEMIDNNSIYGVLNYTK